MRYTTITANATELSKVMKDLEKMVNAHIKDGWKPQGGVSLSVAQMQYDHYSKEDFFNMAQAMIKED